MATAHPMLAEPWRNANAAARMLGLREPYAPFEWRDPREVCSPVDQGLQAARLLAAVPSSYEPRLPLALLLPYARALIMEPTAHRWCVIAQVCAMIHGLGLPRQERKRR